MIGDDFSQLEGTSLATGRSKYSAYNKPGGFDGKSMKDSVVDGAPIKGATYRKKEDLGQGTFGLVKLAQRKQDGLMVAMKLFDTSQMPTEEI